MNKDKTTTSDNNKEKSDVIEHLKNNANVNNYKDMYNSRTIKNCYVADEYNKKTNANESKAQKNKNDNYTKNVEVITNNKKDTRKTRLSTMKYATEKICNAYANSTHSETCDCTDQKTVVQKSNSNKIDQKYYNNMIDEQNEQYSAHRHIKTSNMYRNATKMTDKYSAHSSILQSGTNNDNLIDIDATTEQIDNTNVKVNNVRTENKCVVDENKTSINEIIDIDRKDTKGYIAEIDIDTYNVNENTDCIVNLQSNKSKQCVYHTNETVSKQSCNNNKDDVTHCHTTNKTAINYDKQILFYDKNTAKTNADNKNTTLVAQKVIYAPSKVLEHSQEEKIELSKVEENYKKTREIYAIMSYKQNKAENDANTRKSVRGAQNVTRDVQRGRTASGNIRYNEDTYKQRYMRHVNDNFTYHNQYKERMNTNRYDKYDNRPYFDKHHQTKSYANDNNTYKKPLHGRYFDTSPYIRFFDTPGYYKNINNLYHSNKSTPCKYYTEEPMYSPRVSKYTNLIFDEYRIDLSDKQETMTESVVKETLIDQFLPHKKNKQSINNDSKQNNDNKQNKRKINNYWNTEFDEYFFDNMREFSNESEEFEWYHIKVIRKNVQNQQIKTENDKIIEEMEEELKVERKKVERLLNREVKVYTDEEMIELQMYCVKLLQRNEKQEDMNRKKYNIITKSTKDNKIDVSGNKNKCDSNDATKNVKVDKNTEDVKIDNFRKNVEVDDLTKKDKINVVTKDVVYSSIDTAKVAKTKEDTNMQKKNENIIQTNKQGNTTTKKHNINNNTCRIGNNKSNTQRKNAKTTIKTRKKKMIIDVSSTTESDVIAKKHIKTEKSDKTKRHITLESEDVAKRHCTKERKDTIKTNIETKSDIIERQDDNNTKRRNVKRKNVNNDKYKKQNVDVIGSKSIKHENTVTTTKLNSLDSCNNESSIINKSDMNEYEEKKVIDKYTKNLQQDMVERDVVVYKRNKDKNKVEFKEKKSKYKIRVGIDSDIYNGTKVRLNVNGEMMNDIRQHNEDVSCGESMNLYNNDKKSVLKKVPDILVCELHENLEIKKSEIHKDGLFTKVDLVSSDVIGEYVGEVIDKPESDRREKAYLKENKKDVYMFSIDSDAIIDATRIGSKLRFINHCCKPNCYAVVRSVGKVKRVFILAAEKIAKNTELTIDYQFKTEDGEERIECFCKSEECRGYIDT
ncbi:Histone-lysine N-methyltransferase setd1b [Binucleata daphniae]